MALGLRDLFEVSYTVIEEGGLRYGALLESRKLRRKSCTHRDPFVIG